MSVSLILEGLLFAYWILASGAVLVTLSPLPLPTSFKLAVRLSAARGKLCTGSVQELPLWLQDLKVPQAWFLHFYVIGALCNLLVLLLHGSWCCHGIDAGSAATEREWQSLLVLALFQIHLVRRTLETAFLFKYPKDAKMHVIAYIFGLSYYVVVPLSLVPRATLQHLDDPAFAMTSLDSSTVESKLRAGIDVWTQVGFALNLLGAAVFLLGNALQLRAHCQLRALQEQSAAQEKVKTQHGSSTAQHDAYLQHSVSTADATQYKVPTGGMFELVSCPHYLAEIVVYMGLALVTRGTPLALLVLVWVVSNLVLAANATHAWYRRQFKDYPPRRKALFPFLL